MLCGVEPITHAWAAGIVDADGCITIKRRKVKGDVYYSLFVIVAQSGDGVPPVIARLSEVYGGNVDRPYTAPKGLPNRRPRHQWYVSTARAEEFLRTIRPYLVGKADQADLALDYRDTAMGRGNRALAESFYERMRATKNYTSADQAAASSRNSGASRSVTGSRV